MHGSAAVLARSHLQTRLGVAAYAEKYGSMTSRWCRVLAPILPLSRGLLTYP